MDVRQQHAAVVRGGGDGNPPPHARSSACLLGVRLFLLCAFFASLLCCRYLHQYLAEMPDLNWRNPEVLQEFKAIVRFWIAQCASVVRLAA